MSFRLDWSAFSGRRVATLRNARGSGNPPNRPYRLMIQEDGKPLGSVWMGRTDLAMLLNQLSRELNVMPITGAPIENVQE